MSKNIYYIVCLLKKSKCFIDLFFNFEIIKILFFFQFRDFQKFCNYSSFFSRSKSSRTKKTASRSCSNAVSFQQCPYSKIVGQVVLKKPFEFGIGDDSKQPIPIGGLFLTRIF